MTEDTKVHQQMMISFSTASVVDSRAEEIQQVLYSPALATRGL
jgi:hypothetical protein